MKRLFWYFTGLMILSLGVTMIVSANLGASPWDLFTVALSSKTGITLGTAVVLIQATMIIVSKFLFKKPLNLFSIIPAFIQALFMDLLIVFNFNKLGLSPYMMLIVGSLLIAIALSIYPYQGYSANAVDDFTLNLNRIKKVRLGLAKIITDLIPLVIIFVMGVIPHWSSILVYFLVPLFVELVGRVPYFFNLKLQDSNTRELAQES